MFSPSDDFVNHTKRHGASANTTTQGDSGKDCAYETLLKIP